MLFYIDVDSFILESTCRVLLAQVQRTEWNPIRSVIIRMINKIGRPRSMSPICYNREYDYRLMKRRYGYGSCNRNLSNCKFKPGKNFQGFSRIRTNDLCVSAAVLYQLSYEDPYVGNRPIYISSSCLPVTGIRREMKLI